MTFSEFYIKQVNVIKQILLPDILSANSDILHSILSKSNAFQREIHKLNSLVGSINKEFNEYQDSSNEYNKYLDDNNAECSDDCQPDCGGGDCCGSTSSEELDSEYRKISEKYSKAKENYYLYDSEIELCIRNMIVITNSELRSHFDEKYSALMGVGDSLG